MKPTGLVYNVTANLNLIDYDTVRKIGAIVRRCARVSRVIVFGGKSTSNEAIAAAAQSRQNMYAGINAPLSGVYRQGFRVVHLGYGVDETVQVPACLKRQGIPTSLIGKVADIVANPGGDNFGGIVDSAHIMALTLSEAQRRTPASSAAIYRKPIWPGMRRMWRVMRSACNWWTGI